MNDGNNVPVGETRQLTPVLIILCFFFSYSLDVQKCNMRLSGAETQHERLPGIISMAKK